MAEDAPVSRLPQRAPGRRHLPGGRQRPGPVGPPALSDDDLQRIRDALDAVRNEASSQQPAARAEKPAARAEQPVSLPGRAPGPNGDPEPSAAVAEPEPPSWPRSGADEASTDELAAVAASRSDSGPEEITAQQDAGARPESAIATPPEPVTVRSADPEPADPERAAAPPELAAAVPDESAIAVSAGPELAADVLADPELPADGSGFAGPIPVYRPAEDEQPEQDHPSEDMEHPEPARGRTPARRTKRLARWLKARWPKPAPPRRPSRSQQRARLRAPRARDEPVPQLAPNFPEEPAAGEVGIRPPAAMQLPPSRQGLGIRGVGWAILMLALISGISGSLALLLTRHTDTVAAPASFGPGAAVRNRAATWVASQVSRANLIFCDQAMCQSLKAHHVPAASMRVLEPGVGSLTHSGVIVVTAAVRRMAGARLVSAIAPEVIASFGSGDTRISIRVIYPGGAVAYPSALSSDIASRKADGTKLLQNPQITVSELAHRQLTTGQVDARILETLGVLSSRWPLFIVTFGDPDPGAGLGISLRRAYLVVRGRPGSDLTALARSMSSVLPSRAGSPYQGGRIQAAQLAGGRSVVRIEFPAPSAIGSPG
jgi:hypothetical protein